MLSGLSRARRRAFILLPTIGLATFGGLSAPASASANGCTIKKVTKDFTASVCTSVVGKNLDVSKITGFYGGVPTNNKLNLNINGRVVYEVQFLHKSSFNVTFPSKFDHRYPKGTRIKVCARNLDFVGGLCGKTVVIGG